VTTRGEDIVSIIKQQIEQFGTAITMVDVGTVIEVGDGIARIHGLASVKYNELLQFPNDIIGIALNLEEDSVSSVVLGDYTQIKEGDEVRCTGRIAEVPVGEALIGRVVDPLGRPQEPCWKSLNWPSRSDCFRWCHAQTQEVLLATHQARRVAPAVQHQQRADQQR